ncbi:hypothetical protein QL285_012190 [Trifolium repens]|nr:hypothetical protein QL285_012190 [Trifolium repens]
MCWKKTDIWNFAGLNRRFTHTFIKLIMRLWRLTQCGELKLRIYKTAFTLRTMSNLSLTLPRCNLYMMHHTEPKCGNYMSQKLGSIANVERHCITPV